MVVKNLHYVFREIIISTKIIVLADYTPCEFIARESLISLFSYNLLTSLISHKGIELWHVFLLAINSKPYILYMYL